MYALRPRQAKPRTTRSFRSTWRGCPSAWAAWCSCRRLKRVVLCSMAFPLFLVQSIFENRCPFCESCMMFVQTPWAFCVLFNVPKRGEQRGGIRKNQSPLKWLKSDLKALFKWFAGRIPPLSDPALGDSDLFCVLLWGSLAFVCSVVFFCELTNVACTRCGKNNRRSVNLAYLCFKITSTLKCVMAICLQRVVNARWVPHPMVVASPSLLSVSIMFVVTARC